MSRSTSPRWSRAWPGAAIKQRQTCNRTLYEVAVRVGYDSDVAFNHAFKRRVGQSPAAWRLATEEY